MVNDQRIDEVIAKIETAFAEVEHPGDDHLLHDECLDDSDIEDFYGGVGWRDVPSKMIDKNSASLCFFSPEAFQYYLPAYMIWVLQNYTTDSITISTTISSLNAEPGDLRRFVLSKLSLLTKPQRMAIIAFLEFLRDHLHDADAEEAEDALNSWWLDHEGS